MNVEFKLETFEGPLDLLLHLIDQAEVDIYDIPISEITDQYMAYVQTWQELELEIASEFLVMAATLLAIKSKLLLPKPPPVDLEFEMEDPSLDPREELIMKLLEYRKYKEAAGQLRDRAEERSLIYSREPQDLTPFMPRIPENPVKDLHVADLVLAFQKVLKRVASRDRVTRVRRDEISVKDRIRDVLMSLRKKGGKLLFSQLFSEEMTREEIVVTFLAMLELMKMKRVSCYQHRLFEDIVIQYQEKDGEDDDDGLPEVEIHY